MVNVSAQVDTSAFDKAWKEYVQFNKRALPELVNQTAYFVARNAVAQTKASTKEQIRSDLLKPSKKFGNAPLASILVNKQRGIKGQYGLNGSRMETAVQTFIRIREATRNFVRGGGIPAVKKLAPVVPNKKGQAKLPTGVKQKGSAKGGATIALKESWNPFAEIWNAVTGGKKANPHVTEVITQGYQKALDEETGSKLEYNARHKMEEGIIKFNAS